MIYTRLLSNLQRKLALLVMCALAGGMSVGLSSAPVMAAGSTDIATPDAMDMPVVKNGLVDETGNSFQISDLMDGPVLINFWATWCAPCIAELPALSRAAEALAEDGITIVLVSIDRGGAEKALPFLQKYGVNGVALGFDPRAKLSRDMGVRGLPTTFLLNQKQTQSWQFVGPYEWDEAEMLTLIRELAGKAQGMNQK